MQTGSLRRVGRGEPRLARHKREQQIEREAAVKIKGNRTSWLMDPGPGLEGIERLQKWSQSQGSEGEVGRWGKSHEARRANKITRQGVSLLTPQSPRASELSSSHTHKYTHHTHGNGPHCRASSYPPSEISLLLLCPAMPFMLFCFVNQK